MRRALLASLLTALLAARVAAAQEHTDELLRLAPPPQRSVEVVATTPRTAALTAVAVAPSDPRFIYLGTADGRVLASADGGVSFDEVALDPSHEPIYGAFRVCETPNGAPFGVEDILDPGLAFGDQALSSNINDLYDFPYGTSGETLLDSPAYWPAPSLDPDPRSVPGHFSLLDAEAGDDAEDADRIGLGLLGPAERFEFSQLMLGRRIARLRLKLTLSFAKLPSAAVAALAVHPTDPRTAYAAGDAGLYKTTDGGSHWDVVPLGGGDAVGRAVAFSDARRVLVGTSEGLYVSLDGTRFEVAVGDEDVTALVPGLAGTTGSVLRERGGTWEADDAPGAVRAVAVTKGALWLATSKGLWRDDTRVGVASLGDVPISSVAVDPADARHVACVAEGHAWESRDGGTRFIVIPLDDLDVRTVAFEASTLRVLTAQKLLRVRATPPSPVAKDRLALLSEHLRAEPRLEAVIAAALRTHGVHPDTWRDVRRHAWLVGLLPTVNVMAGVIDTTMHAGIDAAFLGPGVLGGLHGRAPYGFGGNASLITREVTSGVPWWGVYAWWDFAALVFHEAEAPIGPDAEVAAALYQELKSEVARLYAERRAVLSLLVTAPPDDAARALGLRMRLEEATVTLDALSGGLYGPWLRALEQTPYLSN